MITLRIVHIAAYIHMPVLIFIADIDRYSGPTLHINRYLQSIVLKPVNICEYISRCTLCHDPAIIQYVYFIRHKCLSYPVSHHYYGYFLFFVQSLHKLQHILCSLRVKHGCRLV